MKVLVSCANGSGTSLMMLKTVEQVLENLNISITKSNHCSIAEGKSSAGQYDAVFTPLNFSDMFKEAKKKGITVVGVKNVLSVKEITERIVNETDLVERFSQK
ncbi:MAG: PTS sugar transporter subunit IIB [Streptococcaceae bacterium]|jgi:PTS system ascorbate-specific IIB component|nr:PTS sugar transporter subunit IIB [Streptococcaceae bacterium]